MTDLGTHPDYPDLQGFATVINESGNIIAGCAHDSTGNISYPLIWLNFNQQRLEADFRHHMVRVREYSESIALDQGEPVRLERKVPKLAWIHVDAGRLGRTDFTQGELLVQAGYDAARQALAGQWRAHAARRARLERLSLPELTVSPGRAKKR